MPSSIPSSRIIIMGVISPNYIFSPECPTIVVCLCIRWLEVDPSLPVLQRSPRGPISCAWSRAESISSGYHCNAARGFYSSRKSINSSTASILRFYWTASDFCSFAFLSSSYRSGMRLLGSMRAWLWQLKTSRSNLEAPCFAIPCWMGTDSWAFSCGIFYLNFLLSSLIFFIKSGW